MEMECQISSKGINMMGSANLKRVQYNQHTRSSLEVMTRYFAREYRLEITADHQLKNLQLKFMPLQEVKAAYSSFE